MNKRLELYLALVLLGCLSLLGCSDKGEEPTNTQPVASFTVSPDSGTTETAFQFDASSCSDAEDAVELLQVRWDWENDGEWDTGWSTAKTAQHQYEIASPKTVCLEVKDTGGLSDSTTRTIRVDAANSPPIITSIFATADTVDPTAKVILICNASDIDGDPLSFTWSADGGEISGSGSYVQWLAPVEAGFYGIRVEVTDGRGGIASDSIEIAVNNCFFLAQTQSGLIKVTLDGTKSLFYHVGGEVEILDERIFIGPGGNILELDLTGNLVRTITRPSQIPGATTFVVLPNAGFAFVNNNNDSIYFMGPNGEFVGARPIVEPSPTTLQSTKGLVVGGTLLMADSDAYGVLAYDLSTYAGTVFRDFKAQGVRPTDVDHSNGTFYISDLNMKIRRLAEDGSLETISSLPQAHLCAIAVVGSYAYTVINSQGALYKVNLETGGYEILTSGLNYPQDLEFVRLGP